MNKIDICDELSQNFIDFSYETNSQRAFPDARDGLKPGQRACLWEMFSKGYLSSKPHVKSAKISGGVVANFWPHGTTAIYETFARMSQDWINNIPEVDWHGMNGSQIISGQPAAERYSEARLSKISEEGLFKGIKKNNVPMIPNFSEDAEWPEVLPAIFPRLLVNGCQGIGTTISNTWLPVPFVEAAAVILKYIDTGEVNYSLIAPSFPSGGIIINKEDIHTIYETGKGKVILRGKTYIKGNSIFISEMPYQVYVEPFIDEVKNLIKEDKLLGIEDIKNRSDKKGLLIEIVCENNPSAVLEDLYDKTSLQSTYSANQWALVGKTPKLLTLKDYCKIYVAHNVECYKREIDFDLTKAKKRQHIVDGLLIALEDIDNIIKLIKQSSSSSEAKTNLISKYKLDETQAQAILDMKLAKLAHLEKIELENEKKELTNQINEFETILGNKELQLKEVKSRLTNLVEKFGDARKTELQQITIVKSKTKEKKVENCGITISKIGLVKRSSKTANTTTADFLFVFSNKGKMYRSPVDAVLPSGKYVGELTKMPEDEKPLEYLLSNNPDGDNYIVFVTKYGIIKRVPIEQYATVKRTGVATIKLKEGDELVSVSKVKIEDKEEIILTTKKKRVLKFSLTDLPISSRTAQGVKGITLEEGDEVTQSKIVVSDTEIKLSKRGNKGK